MRTYIVDTKLVKRLVTEDEMTSTYLRAKQINREDGNRGPLSILHVASTMNVTRSRAAHMIRLNIEKLDYIEQEV